MQEIQSLPADIKAAVEAFEAARDQAAAQERTSRRQAVFAAIDDAITRDVEAVALTHEEFHLASGRMNRVDGDVREYTSGAGAITCYALNSPPHKRLLLKAELRVKAYRDAMRR